MRILLINDGITDGVSGGDLHSFEVLSRWGLSNDVHSFSPEEAQHLFTDSHIKSKFFRTPLGWNRFNSKHVTANTMILYLLRVFAIIPKMPRMKFDVIIASSHYPHDLVPAVFHLLTNPGAELIVYHHGMNEIKSGTRGLISSVYGTFGTLLSKKFASLIFTINQDVRSYLLSVGINGNSIVLTTNGVNVTLPPNAKSERKFDACFAGVMRKEKGIADLLEVWERVCKAKPDAVLVMIGGGEELNRAKALIDERNLSRNIIILGWLFGDSRFEALANSRMLIFPSYLESWGIAIAEAMAFGLPTVAYDLPSYREVFDNKLLTVPAGDVEAMAKLVLFLLDNPALARKAGDEGREFVKRYDWNTVAEKELSAIASLVQKRRARH
jgi:glycosyltransferase involved in cell wall biosynthesis